MKITNDTKNYTQQQQQQQHPYTHTHQRKIWKTRANVIISRVFPPFSFVPMYLSVVKLFLCVYCACMMGTICHGPKGNGDGRRYEQLLHAYLHTQSRTRFSSWKKKKSKTQPILHWNESILFTRSNCFNYDHNRHFFGEWMKRTPCIPNTCNLCRRVLFFDHLYFTTVIPFISHLLYD